MADVAPLPETIEAELWPVAEIETKLDNGLIEVVVGIPGPEGAKGDKGDRGLTGDTATSRSYAFPEPTLVWEVAHGLNRYPIPVVVDTAGDVLLVSPKYIDANTLIVTFTAPVAGSLYLN